MPLPLPTLKSLTVTALTSRVIMARLSVRVYMSIDLTPKRHIYTASPLYIDLHTTSFVNHTQSPRTSYLDSWHVL